MHHSIQVLGKAVSFSPYIATKSARTSTGLTAVRASDLSSLFLISALCLPFLSSRQTHLLVGTDARRPSSTVPPSLAASVEQVEQLTPHRHGRPAHRRAHRIRPEQHSGHHRHPTEHRAILLQVQVHRKLPERRYTDAGWLQLGALGWLDLLRRRSWRRTAVAVGVAFFQQFSGINAFIYYAPTLFQSLGQSSEKALIMSGVFNIIQLVAVTVCFFIIDHVGRRLLAIAGALGEGRGGFVKGERMACETL
ncbi:General substrate transporter [Moelleriella libera RCEF 2490]|uniref:General substrate transporter n=1 Tax=Moelleriella libera RCEF 2490 TaxID=1081109 RepID=A0A166ULX7_9HYPO|nr:General substrate transporter [Moelleriella libera RCEF 2490]